VTHPGRPPRRMWSWAWRGRVLSHPTRHRLTCRSSRGTLRRQTVRRCRTTCGSTLSSTGTGGSITVHGTSMHWVCLRRPRSGVQEILPAGWMGGYSFRSLHPGPLPAVCTTPVAAASPAGFLCLAEAHHPSHQGLPTWTDGPQPPHHKRGGGSGPFCLDNEGSGLLQGAVDVHPLAPRRTSDSAGWA